MEVEGRNFVAAVAALEEGLGVCGTLEGVPVATRQPQQMIKSETSVQLNSVTLNQWARDLQ